MGCEPGDPFLERYRPRGLDGFVGNRLAVERLKAIVGGFVEAPVVVLWGPEGVGKTTAACAFACDYLRERGVFGEDCGLLGLWPPLDPHPVLFRSCPVDLEEVTQFLGFRQVLAVRKILILDHAERLGADGLGVLAGLIAKHSEKNIVVFVCDRDPEDWFLRVFRELGVAVESIRFDTLTDEEILGFLGRVAKAEGAVVGERGLQDIVRASGGRIAGALRMLGEALVHKKKASAPRPKEGGKAFGAGGSATPLLVRFQRVHQRQHTYDFIMVCGNVVPRLRVDTVNRRYKIVELSYVGGRVDEEEAKHVVEGLVGDSPLDIKVRYRGETKTLGQIIEEFETQIGETQGGAESGAQQGDQRDRWAAWGEERFPVYEYLKQVAGKTIYRGGKLWRAVVVTEDPRGERSVRIYLWRFKDGRWKVSQKYNIRSRESWEKLKDAIEEFIGEL